MSCLFELDQPSRRASSIGLAWIVSCLPLLLSSCANLSDRRLSESTYHAGDSLRGNDHTIRVGRNEGLSDGVGELYREAHRRANERCQGYEIVRDKLYEGHEATSAMLGMSGPWVELQIRCPLQNRDLPLADAHLIVGQESRLIEGASFFDIHAEVFDHDFSATFSAVQRVLHQQEDAVYRLDRESGLIITGKARHGPLGFPLYEQYVIAFDRIASSKTRVVFRLMVHYPRFEEGRRPGAMELIPVDRRFAYRRAAAFIEAVRKQVR